MSRVSLLASCRVYQVKPSDQHQQAADFFQEGGAFGALVPVKVALDKSSERTCQDDHRTVSNSIDTDQRGAEKGIGVGQLESNTEDRCHEGESAGAESNTEGESQDESSKKAFPLYPDLAKPGPWNRDHPQ